MVPGKTILKFNLHVNYLVHVHRFGASFNSIQCGIFFAAKNVYKVIQN